MKQPNWREVMWCMYDYSVNHAPRKETLRRIIACGLTARQAIEEMRNYEREP